MDYVRQLEESFRQRQNQNPGYSLRAYARDLGLHPSTLSKILKGVRGVPFSDLDTVTTRLSLTQEEKDQFFLTALQKRGYGSSKKKLWPTPPLKTLKNDLHFRIISEWEHYAVLSLIKLKKFKSETSWMSARLGISSARCQKVLDNLLKSELIKKNESGQWMRCHKKISSSDGVSATALKMAHQHDLQLAASKLWKTSVDERDYCSNMMSINPKKLKKAKQLTRLFIKEMESLLESGDATEVYQLSVQLFPLTTHQPPRGRA